MKTLIVSARSLVVLLGLALLLSASAVFAAVQLSVSKQQVKTLTASLGYAEIISAYQPEGPNTRLLEVAQIPVDTEILSAHIRVTSGFENVVLNPNATLNVCSFGAESIEVAGLADGTIRAVGYVNDEQTISVNKTLVFDSVKSLCIYVYDGAGKDLSQLSNGSLEIVVNYLNH